MDTKYIKVEGYNIIPMFEKELINNKEFNIVNTGKDRVLIAKTPITIHERLFWIIIYEKDLRVKKVELRFSEPQYSLKYRMENNLSNDKIIDEYNVFLIGLLGTPHNEKNSGIRYSFDWGEVFSYYDLKSSECGIVIEYNE